MTPEIINGRIIAEKIKKQLTTELNSLKKQYDIYPKVVTIKVGHDPSSELYLKLRDQACKKVGIHTEHRNYEANITQDQLLTTIQGLNLDPTIHGIMVQYPLPSHISQHTIIQSITPTKDIEGLHPHNLGQLLIQKDTLTPCTPQAIMHILDHEKITLQGKNIVIINHSNIVGKPLSIMCLNKNATVIICHEFTTNLTQYTTTADILISATGIPHFITADHIKNNSILIDVGIVQTKNGITGDFDRSSVDDKAQKITPVPGGVGPVTIASAINNMVKIIRTRCHNQTQ